MMSADGAGLGLIPLVRYKKRKQDLGLSLEDLDSNERTITSSNDAEHRDHCTGNTCDSFVTNESLIRISGSSASPVVIGRPQLLKSFRAACNQHKSEGEEDNLYRETLQWGSKALSRKLLRFSDARMQIRGKFVRVGINGATISSNLPDNSNDTHENPSLQHLPNPEDGWGRSTVKIKPGDVLSFKPIGGHGLLEFRVVALEPSTRSENNEWTISKRNHTAKPSTKRNHTSESTKPRIIDLTDESKQGETNKRAKIDSTLPRQHPNTTKDSSFLVYFFPFGNGFSASRREKLGRNLEKLGATIAEDIFKAKYVVISESIRSLAIVAKKLRVEEDYLVHHFQNNPDVRCILPSWADHCISSTKCLVVPSRVHDWCHYSAVMSPLNTPKTLNNGTSQNRNRDESHSAGKQAITQELMGRKKVIVTGDDTIQTRRKCFQRNIDVAEAFKTLSNLHQSMSLLETDTWKSYCFRIVAGRLLELDFEVSNDHETQQKLRSIKGFGKSVCDKIQECIEYGTISRIQEFQSDPQRMAMKNLKDIWGVGTVTARHLMDRGYRTIEDVRLGVRQGRLLLERNQLVGVDCYEDILDPMSRSEVEEIGEIVRHIANRLFPGIEASIMGSYRRGKESCGDVDIQLTHPDFVKKIPTDALGRIIDVLWNEGKIAMHLTFLEGMTTGRQHIDYCNAARHVPLDAWEKTKISSNETEHKFYMGCFYSPVHPPRRRRVDIKFYPYRERAFATLYFTGNGYFNRSMRLWATRVFGFRLSDHGLFARAAPSVRVFEASSEREIFDRLKLVYREPHERQYWDALEPIDTAIKPDLKLTKSQLDYDRNFQWVK